MNPLLKHVGAGAFQNFPSRNLPTVPSSVTEGLLEYPHYQIDWNCIADYSKQYKELVFTDDLTRSETQQELWNYDDTVNTSRTPVLAAVQILISYDNRTEQELIDAGVSTLPPAGKKAVGLRLHPMITLWNPYNVSLKIHRAMVYELSSLPFSFELKVGGTC